jgi:hypothetical protein
VRRHELAGDDGSNSGGLTGDRDCRDNLGQAIGLADAVTAHHLQTRSEGRQACAAADRAHSECRYVDADVEIAIGQCLHDGDWRQSGEIGSILARCQHVGGNAVRGVEARS